MGDSSGEYVDFLCGRDGIMNSRTAGWTFQGDWTFQGYMLASSRMETGMCKDGAQFRVYVDSARCWDCPLVSARTHYKITNTFSIARARRTAALTQSSRDN